MWQLCTYKRIFVFIGFIAVLLIFVPPIESLIYVPCSESFSEIGLIGPEHTTSGYPYHVSQGVEYSIYVDVGNHMGRSMYYRVLVKFQNSSESLPGASEGDPSSSPALYSYDIFLKDGQVWEDSLTFSFANATFGQNMSLIDRMNINGSWKDVGKNTAFDNATGEYRYNLLVELWIYDVPSDTFVYHNRYVSLHLDMMQSM